MGQSVKRFHSIAGPFKIIFKRVEQCPVRGDGINYTLKYVSYRKAHKFGPIYNVNATLNFIMDGNLTLRGTLASWSNMGGWKENAHSIQVKNACDKLSRWGGKYWLAFVMSVFGQMLPCPYYPGEYNFRNATCSLADLPVKEFFYGRWRADVELLHPNGKTAFCIRAYADTLPR